MKTDPGTSARMRRIGRRDTPHEVELRRLLHRTGLRYRIDAAPIDGIRRRADIIFPSAKVALFVDGCFWHLCPVHGEIPTRNHEWWNAKLTRNRNRDHETDRFLAEAGWISLRIWEHQAPESVVRRIERLVRNRMGGAA